PGGKASTRPRSPGEYTSSDPLSGDRGRGRDRGRGPCPCANGASSSSPPARSGLHAKIRDISGDVLPDTGGKRGPRRRSGRVNRRTLLKSSLLTGGAVVTGLGATVGSKYASPIVETTSGKVRGVVNNGVHVFRGLPYGVSTAGPKRLPCTATA